VAYTSEIEKLEKRWAENPKGRNFAPLADAYRKAGELDRALELCKAGLDLHPDYVSAHIVYARCLIEQKNDPGASEVFQKVLTLDPENVLALKMLAEIADRGGRFSEVVEWLGRLLNADPMNGDAAEALARAKAKAGQSAGKVAPAAVVVPPPSPPSSPEPVARLVPEARRPPTVARPTPVPAQPDLVIEHESEGPRAPDLAVKGTPSDIETFDGTLDFNAVAHDAARTDGLEVQEEVQLKPQDMVVEGLASTQYDSAMFTPPTEAAPAEEEPVVDLPLIMPDEVGEPMPSARPSPPPPPAPPPPPTARPPAPTPAAVLLSDDDGAADTTALSRAEPVLTETMAELYLRQGHQDDALRVYHALLAQRPGDARLKARIESLTRGGRGGRSGGAAGEEGGGGGETVQAFLRRILTGRLGAPAPESPEPLASSPLDSAFAIAPTEPEPDAGSSSPGEASRPAADNISLDQVFGDEGGAGTPRSPAVPPPAASTSQPSGPPSGGFSFDQFFSPTPIPAASPSPGPGPAPDSGPGRAPPAPKTSERASGPKARPPAAEDEGDLDQFQAWLRGLKS
jgi:tetratricopeptide (TPR) repeat protein